MHARIDDRESTRTAIRPPRQARAVSRGRPLPRMLLPVPSRSVSIADAGEGRAKTDDDGLSTFMSVRPNLLGVAYRMLRSAAEAEDIVQDAWVRWQTADRRLVRDAAAFLMTTVTRLAINVMQSARWRREERVKFRQREPVDTSADSGLEAERREAVEVSVQILLQKLSQTERAAYVLREAFGYEHRDIAKVLRLEDANARQVVTRARQHLADARTNEASPTERRRLVDAFIAAARRGDVSGLERLLASKSSARRPARRAEQGRKFCLCLENDGRQLAAAR
jgi:RNA polymerase sigma factor (sigma-70 family)